MRSALLRVAGRVRYSSGSPLACAWRGAAVAGAQAAGPAGGWSGSVAGCATPLAVSNEYSLRQQLPCSWLAYSTDTSSGSGSSTEAGSSSAPPASGGSSTTSGSGDSGPTLSDQDIKTLQAVQALVDQVSELSQQGQDGQAMQVLQEAIPKFAEEHGASSLGLAVLYSQLSTFAFYAGEYETALSAAKQQHKIWADSFGESSAETAMNDLRLGIALLGNGQPHEAFTRVELAGRVAAHNFNSHLEQHALLSKSEDSRAPEALAVVEEALQKCGRTVCEARLYRALSALWAASPSMEADYQEKGLGAVHLLCSEMEEALGRLLMFVGPGHPSAASFVREHGRLVQQAGEQGLQQVHSQLQDNHAKLQNVVAEASASL